MRTPGARSRLAKAQQRYRTLDGDAVNDVLLGRLLGSLHQCAANVCFRGVRSKRKFAEQLSQGAIDAVVSTVNTGTVTM